MHTTREQEFYECYTLLNDTQKEILLQLAKRFTGLDEQATRQTLEEYNKDIDDALEEVAAGQFISQKEMEKQAAQW